MSVSCKRSGWMLVFGWTLFGSCLDTPHEKTAAELEAYMNAVAELGHFSGTVLVAHRGEVLLRKGYGPADIDSGRPNEPDTKFRIASVSKSFTAMAVLVLRKKGLLSLDDALSEYFPQGPASWREVKLRHLLAHTSGIPDYEFLLNVRRMEDYSVFRAKPGHLSRLLEKALASELELEPGTEYKYSNTGYLLLGFIVEKVAGAPFGVFLERELLNPFGLADSGEDRHDLALSNRAKPYLLKPDRTDREYWAGFAPDSGMLEEAPTMRMETPNGAGGLYSTVDDLFAWIAGLRKLAGADPDFEDIFSPGLKGYAKGWFVGERFGRKWIWHSGGLPGYVSILEHYPEEEATVVLLGNTDQYSGPVAEDLAAILFGEPYPLPRPHHLIDLDPALLEPLHGTYRSNDGRVYRVYREEAKLVIAQEDEFTSDMLPESETSFFVPKLRGNVKVQKDPTGAVLALVANIQGKKVLLSKAPQQ